jgi:DNA-binding Lrp family transcriptional regulator
MTVLDPRDKDLLGAVAEGLPLVSEPYAVIARRLGMAEQEVIDRVGHLIDSGVIKRLGLVVRHHELGYTANAMVVWDVPDQRAADLGRLAARFDFVTLCYRRPRRLPKWPFNLFCMIHGKDRDEVRHLIARLNDTELGAYTHATLFSRRRFKQCGARVENGGRRADVVPLDPVDRAIVNGLQGGFPVSECPFAEAAERLGISEADLIGRVEALVDRGVLSRFGPMINAERLGGDVILAAMAVPDGEFERVAELVNAHPEVAHNYARDHRLNMWFVLSVERPERIAEVIAEIEHETGLHVFPMPKLEEFFVEFKVEV